MSSMPSCKFHFSTEDEFQTVLMIAAQHNLKLNEYARACVIKVTQEVIDSRNAEAEAAAAQIPADAQSDVQSELAPTGDTNDATTEVTEGPQENESDTSAES